MAKGSQFADDFSVAKPSGNDTGNEGGTTDSTPKSDTASGTIDGISGSIDPETARGTSSSSTAGEAPKRGRGRPKGSKNTGTKESVSPDIGAIEALLISLHTMMAIRIPEMAIEKTEAHLLAESIGRVSAYYPQVSAIITGRIAAHASLVMAIGQVYGTRIIAIQTRIKKEANPAPNTVYDMATGKPYQPSYQ